MGEAKFHKQQAEDVRNDRLFNLLSKLGFRDFLHFAKYHRRNFLWAEILLFAKVLDLNEGRALPIDDCKWPVTDILLYIRVTRVESIVRSSEKAGRTHSKRRPMRRFASKTAKEAIKYEKNSRRKAYWARGRRTVFWVHGRLVFCRIADETFVTGKGDIRWGGSVTLCVVLVSRKPVIPGIRTIVCNDFDPVVLPDTNAAAGNSLGIVSYGLLHHTSRWYRDQYRQRLGNAK